MGRYGAGDPGRAFRSAMASAWITGLLGVAFLASKVAEWIKLVRGGHSFTANEFFQYYFFSPVST